MSITIKHNKIPVLSQVKFTVDGKLDPKLDNIEIFKCMNKSNFTLFLGKGGSGKSSKIISFLKSKEGFKKIFQLLDRILPYGVIRAERCGLKL